MKINKCFILGHRPDTADLYRTCKRCGQISNGYIGEYNLFVRMWDYVYNSPISLLLLFARLLVLIATVGATSAYNTNLESLTNKCLYNANIMGLESKFVKETLTCFVNYKDFGWVPFDKIFMLMGK